MKAIHRIPVLCGAISAAALTLKASAGVRAFDPALIYILFPQELRGFPDGCACVDLTHVPQPATNAAWALRDMMDERVMKPIPMLELRAAIEQWHRDHPGHMGKTA